MTKAIRSQYLSTKSYIFFIIVMVVVFFCGIFVSQYQIGDISFNYWPFVRSSLIQELKSDQIIYNDVLVYEPVGENYRPYKNALGVLRFPVPESIDYVQVDIMIAGFSNTVSRIEWINSDGKLIEEKGIELTSRLNAIPVPEGANSAGLHLSVLENRELEIQVKSVKFYNGFPFSRELTKHTLLIALPLVFIAAMIIFKRDSFYFDSDFKWKKQVAALFSFIFIGISFYVFHPSTLYYDAWGYNNIAASIFPQGYLNLSLYPSHEIRGYFWPLLIGIMQNSLVWLFNDIWISFYFWSAIIFCILFSVLIPTLMEQLFHYKTSLLSCLIPTLLVLPFWGATLGFPLSDMPAAALLLCSLLVLLILNKTHRLLGGVVLSFSLGALMYATYNVRTAYIFLFLVIPVMFFWKNWGKGAIFISCGFAAMILGVILIAAPQGYLNVRDYGDWSPFVVTGIGEDNLYVKQLQWGMDLQRYETYVGNGDSFNAGLRFSDPQGSAAYQSIFGGKSFTILEYILQVVRHPHTFIGIYTRHIINTLNHCFPELYIEDLHMPRIGLSLISYTLWFVGATGIVLKWSEKKQPWNNMVVMKSLSTWFEKRGAYLLLLLFVPFVNIMGAMELRFFLVGYLLLYYYLVMGVDYKLLITQLKKNTILIGLLYLAGFAICMAVWPTPSIVL